MTDYDYTSEIPLGWTAFRCVCGIVVTSANGCPRCKEDADAAH